MRKLMLASVLALPFAVGCQSTGGICDLRAVPGDSTGYNPHVMYHATCPGWPATPVLSTTSPVSTTPGGTESYEPIGPPKKMPSSVAESRSDANSPAFA